MIRRPIAPLVIAFLLVAVSSATAGGPAGRGAAGQPSTDQIVVRLGAGASLDASGLSTSAGLELKAVRRLDDGSYVLKLPNRHALGLVRAITNRLETRNDVALAEPDAILQTLAVPNDTRWAEQWDLLDPSSGQFGASLPGAWDVTTGSGSVTVGVIDTGYRPHADLAGRFVVGLRLHRRSARRKRRRRARRRRFRSGRLDHERRERERVLQGLRNEEQLVARHARRRARSGHPRTTRSVLPGSTGSRTCSR